MKDSTIKKIGEIEEGVPVSLSKTAARNLIADALGIPVATVNGNVRLQINNAVYLFKDECEAGLKKGYYFIPFQVARGKEYSTGSGFKIFRIPDSHFLRYEDNLVDMKGDRYKFFMDNCQEMQVDIPKISTETGENIVSSFTVPISALEDIFGKKTSKVVTKVVPEVAPKVDYDVPTIAEIEIPAPVTPVVEDNYFSEEDYKAKTALEGDNLKSHELTARDAACIQLKVPLTGKPWLNELIQKSKKRYVITTE